jgi:hypothetical protein
MCDANFIEFSIEIFFEFLAQRLSRNFIGDVRVARPLVRVLRTLACPLELCVARTRSSVEYVCDARSRVNRKFKNFCCK